MSLASGWHYVLAFPDLSFISKLRLSQSNFNLFDWTMIVSNFTHPYPHPLLNRMADVRDKTCALVRLRMVHVHLCTDLRENVFRPVL